MGIISVTPIVVVDDQASNRRIISRLAQSLSDDAKVIAFADPLSALTYMKANTPELVITDFKMMPINGDEFIRRFRQIPACADVPTVVITAYQDVAFRDSAMLAGSTDFLLSPIDHEDFRRRSRDLLLAHRARLVLANADGHEAAHAAFEHDGVADERTDMVSSMLQTVNTHLVAALAELAQTKSDLNTMAVESNIAVAFVDNSMKLRRFSPGLQAIAEATAPTDRVLTMMIAKLGYLELSQDFARAMETREPVQRYLEAPDHGIHYRVKILPQHLAGNAVDGAAITFIRVGAWSAGHS